MTTLLTLIFAAVFCAAFSVGLEHYWYVRRGRRAFSMDEVAIQFALSLSIIVTYDVITA
jgi:hypothetical protein